MRPPRAMSSEPMGPILAANLTRLGYATIKIRGKELSGLVTEKTGEFLSRPYLSSLANSVEIPDRVMILIAKAINVEVSELTKPL